MRGYLSSSKHIPTVIDKSKHVKKVGNKVRKFSKMVKTKCITNEGRTNETQHLNSSHKITQVKKCVPKVSTDDRIPKHNRFAILNNIDTAECVLGNVEKVVDNKLSDQFVDCKHDISDGITASSLCNDRKKITAT